MAEHNVLSHPRFTENGADFAEHARTYRRFIGMLAWFLFHIPFLLIGLYVMTLGGQTIAGAAFIVFGLTLLVFGFVRTLST